MNLGLGVCVQLSGLIAPVAHPDDDELHSGILHRLPVHIDLMLGHVHTHHALSGGQVQIAVHTVGKVRGKVGIRRRRGQGLLRRPGNIPLDNVRLRRLPAGLQAPDEGKDDADEHQRRHAHGNGFYQKYLFLFIHLTTPITPWGF